MDLLFSLCSDCAMLRWPQSKIGHLGISEFFVSSFAGVDLEGIFVSVPRDLSDPSDLSGVWRLGQEVHLSCLSKVAIATGFAKTVAIMCKYQRVPPRLNMSQNSTV